MRRILVGSLITIPLVFIAGALLLVGQTQTLPAPTMDHHRCARTSEQHRSFRQFCPCIDHIESAATWR